jgi:hypothetical protein
VRDADFKTMSGVRGDPLSGTSDSELRRLFSYSNGPRIASMCRSKPDDPYVRRFGTAEDRNRRSREILSGGGVGRSTAARLPTLLGRDSDHQSYEEEVGRSGVEIDMLASPISLVSLPSPVLSAGRITSQSSPITLKSSRREASPT